MHFANVKDCYKKGIPFVERKRGLFRIIMTDCRDNEHNNNFGLNYVLC